VTILTRDTFAVADVVAPIALHDIHVTFTVSLFPIVLLCPRCAFAVAGVQVTTQNWEQPPKNSRRFAPDWVSPTSNLCRRGFHRTWLRFLILV